jgi:amino acid adenylation domain-containing protein
MMLRHSQATAIVVDALGEILLPEILPAIGRSLCVLLPHARETSQLAERFPGHRFVGAAGLEPGAFAPKPADPNSVGYLLFTSGSTGEPKAVMVAHRNVNAFVDTMLERYRITEHDRFSQTFDLTFDLSAFDMFVCWKRGACLCVPTRAQKLLPTQYVQQAELTVWHCVPSMAALMKRLQLLKPGAFPRLRYVLFCGEALSLELAESFARAAPNAIVENLYGPTELTIACTAYRYDPAHSPRDSELGLVPIGTPHPGLQILICDDQLRVVAPGEVGELLVAGAQLTLGYFRDEPRTCAAFVVPPGQTQRYYRTGDRVRRAHAEAPLVFLGRADDQIKVRGYRVELGEIEAALRDAAEVDDAVAVGFPVTPEGVDAIVGFVSGSRIDAETIAERLRAKLPPYAQPASIFAIDAIPLSAHGKVDRKALLMLLAMSRSS